MNKSDSSVPFYHRFWQRTTKNARHVGVNGSLLFHKDNQFIIQKEGNVVFLAVEDFRLQCGDFDLGLRAVIGAGNGIVELQQMLLIGKEQAENTASGKCKIFTISSTGQIAICGGSYRDR
ncbi:MAG: hypothetical protein E7223_06940 [Clostridiales bacterium]|nr:hypothetical protein [Clostridiales bacterium]